MSAIGVGRLLVATDRAPFAFGRGERIRVSRGSGGVVTAVRDLAASRPLTWVAAAVDRIDVAVAGARRDRAALLGRGHVAVRLTPVPRRLFRDYRTRFADRILWFVQHGLWAERMAPEGPERVRRLLARYEAVGARYAGAIAAELLRPGQSGSVLLHDYQLYSVPALVRDRLPGARIAHFSHIPWAAPRTWRDAIPADVTVRILRGLLAADVLHFQTQASVEAFLSSVDEFLPDARVRGERIEHGAGGVLVRARPVSLDPLGLHPSAAEVQRLRRCGRRLIVRVDRADPIKNVPLGFLAFERLLESHPEWIGSVTFLARIIPTRIGIPEYRRERERILRAVSRIEQRFGPGTVRLSETADRALALAELAAADVVLVNSRADGMNLVAKEAAVLGRGALVLSRRAGAYRELGEGAIGIDPEDVEGTADALRRGLEMPPGEAAIRSSLLRRRVMAWTARDWLGAQLDDLDEAATARRVAAA